MHPFIKQLLEDKQLISEGFSNDISFGKVPIGIHTFAYTAKGKNLDTIEKSIEARKDMKNMHVSSFKREKDRIIVRADSKTHNSLISSFQSLGIKGSVTD